MKENFNLLEEIIDKEIKTYEKLEELCKQKKELLKKNRVLELNEVDSGILDGFELIKSYESTRKKISHEISGGELNLTEIIKRTLEIDATQSKRFEEKKKKINKLEKSIRTTESLNFNLIKHGMTMIGKILQIIFDHTSVPSNEYNKEGKVINQEDLRLSSVNEEA